jgi:hypothetical protein
VGGGGRAPEENHGEAPIRVFLALDMEMEYRYLIEFYADDVVVMFHR